VTLLWIALAVVLDGAVGLSGAIVPDGWLARHRMDMLGFAVGALVATAALDLIPTAFARTGVIAFAWMAVGVVVIVAVELVLARSHGSRRAGLPYALLGSDAVHNLADGMAIAAAFLISTRLGVVTAAAVIVHEVPEEIADYAVLRAAGLRKRWSLVWLAGVQLTAALGAALVVVGATTFGIEGPALAIGASTFLYIALVDLLPEVVRASHERRSPLGWLGAGIVVMALLS
jgi:zinc and cadmium transporter